jgi:hypothetical protein
LDDFFPKNRQIVTKVEVRIAATDEPLLGIVQYDLNGRA